MGLFLLPQSNPGGLFLRVSFLILELMFQNFGMTHAIDIKLRMEEKKAREGSSTFSASAAFRVQTSGRQSASTEEWMGEKSQSKRWKGPAPCPAAQLSVKEADQRPPYGKLRCRGKGDRRKVRQKAIHSTKNALVPGTLVLACLPMIPCGPHGDILPVMSPHIPFIGLCLLPLRQRSFP